MDFARHSTHRMDRSVRVRAKGRRRGATFELGSRSCRPGQRPHRGLFDRQAGDQRAEDGGHSLEGNQRTGPDSKYSYSYNNCSLV